MNALILVLALFSPQAQAAQEKVLYCVSNFEENMGGPAFQVRQVLAGGEETFQVLVSFPYPGGQPMAVSMEHAGSGDEDYEEFVAVEKNEFVSGAYISNDFSWATLINNDGTASHYCE